MRVKQWWLKHHTCIKTSPHLLRFLTKAGAKVLLFFELTKKFVTFFVYLPFFLYLCTRYETIYILFLLFTD